MPKAYSYYVNNQSGMGAYPKNTQRLAEDAVKVALDQGIEFPAELDKLGLGTVTALFLVHAGLGAESISSETLQKQNIWSHKADVVNPRQVRPGLWVTNYLTVPENARMGVCAHELGHLAFQWDDFYDPNYDEDGRHWDGAGNWDLMAGGSWNNGGLTPAHPAGLHKLQHGWINVNEITATTVGVTLAPFTGSSGSVVRIRSNALSPTQSIILENRVRRGFDASLPSEGLLVWRVDTEQEQVNPDLPAMLLIQADGQHDLEDANDFNAGDAGDPFPGSAHVTALSDQGAISTSFPGRPKSGISINNISRDSLTGIITFDITIE